MSTIEVTDNGVQAVLDRLVSGISNTEPAMRTIGEYIIELSKASFAKSASPDGAPWARNRESTILHYLDQTGGNYTRQGKLSQKGSQRVMGKKPLIGPSRDLSRQFSYVADRNSVTISNTMAYAAMQQFGGRKADFPNLWGDILARPYMPLDAGGALSAAGNQAVMRAVGDYIDALIG